MKYTIYFGPRSVHIAAALLGFLSWVATIDTVAAQTNGAASGSSISICAGYSTQISVAFAYQKIRGISTPQDGGALTQIHANRPTFRSQGAALYYATNAAQYHWGNKVNLYVSAQKFNYDNAQLNRTGAQSEMFSLLELTAQQQSSPVTITLHFIAGNTTYRNHHQEVIILSASGAL